MEKQEKDFILNKGLLLGLVLVFFPIIDLIYGLNISSVNSINYLLIFIIGWPVVYTFLLLTWSKVIISFYDVFPFKDTFRVLFIISSLGFAVLTVGKIAIWNVYSPETYAEINLKRAQSQLSEYKLSNDNIEPDSKLLLYQKEAVIQWSDLKKNGIAKTHFIQILVSVLFINSIYCAILALFIRKKEQFIKTN